MNFSFNILVTITFKSIMVGLGEPGAFWLYASFCLVSLAFVRYMVPETKGP